MHMCTLGCKRVYVLKYSIKHKYGHRIRTWKLCMFVHYMCVRVHIGVWLCVESMWRSGYTRTGGFDTAFVLGMLRSPSCHQFSMLMEILSCFISWQDPFLCRLLQACKKFICACVVCMYDCVCMLACVCVCLCMYIMSLHVYVYHEPTAISFSSNVKGSYECKRSQRHTQQQWATSKSSSQIIAGNNLQTGTNCDQQHFAIYRSRGGWAWW